MTPKAELQVRGSLSATQLKAVVDTSLPVKVAVKIGPRLVGSLTIELADGTEK